MVYKPIANKSSVSQYDEEPAAYELYEAYFQIEVPNLHWFIFRLWISFSALSREVNII